MNNSYCIKCNKDRKFKKSKISNIFDKTQVLSFIWSKCGNKDETIFRNEESVEILEPLGLIDNIEER